MSSVAIERRQISELIGNLSDELPPRLRQIYLGRGITDDSQLNYQLDQLISPNLLKGVGLAVDLLVQSLHAQKKITIVGDFDADGATSSALAILALKAMGFQHVNYVVPNRFHFGYGLTPEIVQYTHDNFQPNVIITVDNGIASNDGVALAKQLGMQVIITDHHLPGDVLPDADAIINPNQPDCDFPSKYCAGVGVIFYLMVAFRKKLRDSNWFVGQKIREPNLADYLDLVALGTICDVVPLDKNNRIFAHQGLLRIRAGKARAGIKALLMIAGRELQSISASDLAFAVGPRLNAAGRLDDMSLGIECLLTDDANNAQMMAAELDTLNRERKLIEKSMCDEAMQFMAQFEDARQPSLHDLPDGICIYDANWHQGVIGILASRIKDKFHRPVIAFAAVSEDEVKGSGRSIPGIHIRDVLAEIAANNPDLKFKFGGHAMAAGLTTNLNDLEVFKTQFEQQITQHYSKELFSAKLLTDGELLPEELNLELASILKQAGPWGQHFPEPVFDGEFQVLKHHWLAEKHLKLRLQYGKQLIEAIAFNADSTLLNYKKIEKVHLVYQLDINDYRGVKTVQLIVNHVEVLA